MPHQNTNGLKEMSISIEKKRGSTKKRAEINGISISFHGKKELKNVAKHRG